MSEIFLRRVLHGLEAIAFPDVCLCCGTQTTDARHLLCPYCLEERFEPAINDHEPASSDVILPEGLSLQQALWKFDRRGALQDLLHHMKYDGIKRIGREFGEFLGGRLKGHAHYQKLAADHRLLLVPVPLHGIKQRMRGYNQSRMIAEGLTEALSLPIVSEGAVVRVKNTRTQTGFTLDKRLQNLECAFAVREPEGFTGATVMLVDDVFTTGATTFELWRTLREAGVEEGAVVTVAQA